MKILIITNNYPYEDSNANIFVKQLVDKMHELGNEVTVIATQSLTNVWIRKNKKRPYIIDIKTNKGTYKCFSPKYISFSIFSFLSPISSYFSKRGVLKTIKRNKLDFDIIYAHFLNGPGTTAYGISNKYNKPFFVALGESTFNFKNKELIEEIVSNATGFIAVSTEIKGRLNDYIENLDSNKIQVFPNGFDNGLFFPMDKEKLRKEHKINSSDFIISFVGSFIDRKGIIRLDQALRELNNPSIKAIFIGQGNQTPNYEHIIFKGVVPHEDINMYLNISDVFVLPTINEGSCNAIIEAIATGLPVISSNKSFNDDILNDSYSIRIDSMSIEEIKKSILTLYNNRNLVKQMSKSALNKAKEFDLNDRANKIVDFIEKNTRNRKLKL